MKWIWSTLAFIFGAIFISSLTTNIFLSAIDSGFEDAKISIKEKSVTFAEENVNSIYAQNPGLKTNIDTLNKLTPALRALALQQCNDPSKKDQPFCDSRFVTGQMDFDDILKESARLSFENAMNLALTQVKEKLDSFAKYSSTWIIIVSGLLSLVFYYLAFGILNGVQKFFGNSSWLAFLSAISYKVMPNLMDKMISTATKNVPVEAQSVSSAMKEITLSWLSPAINEAFVFSLWITAVM